MSTLRVNEISARTGTGNVQMTGGQLIAPGITVGSVYLADSTNINTTSSTFVDAYTMSYTKKLANSALFGFFDINTLREGSQEQNWIITVNDVQVSEVRNKNSSTTGWDTRNMGFHWTAASGGAAGVYTIKLRFRVVGNGYYNYPTAYGNGVSHYIVMEIAQ